MAETINSINKLLQRPTTNAQPKRSSFKKPRGYNMRQNFDFSLNSMKMHDVDLDELLECAEENIENSAFFASSVQVMGILDSTINAIDERLSKKKLRILNMPSTTNSNAVGMLGGDPHPQLIT